MPSDPRRLLVRLIPLLLLAACGATDHQPWESSQLRREHLTARVLNERMQTQLAPDLAVGRAALQPLATGARVTFLDKAQVLGGGTVADPLEGSPRASFVEALLDPSLMRIAVTDTSDLPEDQREERIVSLTSFLRDYGLGPLLIDPATAPAEVTPNGRVPPPSQGLTATILLHCPDRHDGTGYGSGVNRPACY